MEVYVGTSGWLYDWNEGRNLEWYVNNSGLNAVELNSSFYRFPTHSQVKGWVNKGSGLRWSIKVNRLFTHNFKLGVKALERWESFVSIFKPLDHLIDFYLFQLPPNLKPPASTKIEDMYKRTELKGRFALEWRNQEWFKKSWIKWAEDLKLTLVSIDAPNLPRNIFCTNGIVYMRMHGRSSWYSHLYSIDELKEIKLKLKDMHPSKIYVFFNNNTNMLINARQMVSILEEI